MAALDAAANPHQAALAARALVSAACRWVGLLALAATGRSGARIPARARELTRRSVDDAEWLALARDACAAFRSHPEAHPLPELVALDETDPPVIDIDAPTQTEEELRARLALQLGGVAAFLGRLGWLLDYRLVVRRGERVESWTGLRRAPRETVGMAPGGGGAAAD
jgi:hypothetical protein